MSGRVAGKIALVTGAASGLGLATARLLTREGATVIATDIDADGLAAFASDEQAPAVTLVHDVTDRGHWTDVIAEIERRFGVLDILVNNAGIGAMGNIETTTEEDWARIHRVDLDSVFMGCQIALALMKKAQAASIVNISSIAGIIADSNLLAYCSAKAAVRHLTKAVALHCARMGYPIRCNSVHPAFIDTPILDDALPGVPREVLVEKLAETNPMRRLGAPEDVAYAVLYLASDESGFVNGAELVIDGGLSAQ